MSMDFIDEIEVDFSDCQTQPTTRNAVHACLEQGMTYKDIAIQLNISKATISYHATKLGHRKFTKQRTFDWSAIQMDIDAGYSIRDICKRNKLFSKTFYSAANKNLITLRSSYAKLSLEELLQLVENKRANSYRRRLIRRAMIKTGIEKLCAICGNSQWFGKKLPLDLDHIDGNPKNNTIDNLRLLCPNCHSITPTWRGRNVAR